MRMRCGIWGLLGQRFGGISELVLSVQIVIMLTSSQFPCQRRARRHSELEAKAVESLARDELAGCIDCDRADSIVQGTEHHRPSTICVSESIVLLT